MVKIPDLILSVNPTTASKVLCHNLCVVIQAVHELGIETNFGAAMPN